MMQPLHKYTHERYLSLRVWYDFLDRTMPAVKAIPMTGIPGDASQTAVYFAFAPHPYTEYSIRNVMYHLGPLWGLHIFTNQSTQAFVQDITTGWSDIHVTVIDIKLPDSTFDAADILKRSPDFWRLPRGDSLFLFDFDTVLRKPFRIESFLDHDYVAPIWHIDERPDAEHPVGCGAVSLRRKAAMIEVAESENADLEQYPREDMFYALNLSRRGRSRVAPPDVAKDFASQNDVGRDPVALRRPWIGNPPDNMERLLSTIHYWMLP